MTRTPDEQDETFAELMAEVRGIDALSRRIVTSVLAGGYGSVFRGSGVEFDSVREYEDGDDPRSVDWNVTARTGRPFVKRWIDEREQPVLFLLDISPSMDGGFGPWSARQTATRVLGCLALAAIRNGDRVGLTVFGDKIERHLPAKKGTSHVLRIIRDCLALRAVASGSDLAGAIEFTMRAERKRSTMFIVSDFVAEGWEQPLAHCARRHNVVAVRLVVPEWNPPHRGLTRIRDPELNYSAVLDFRDDRVRDELKRRGTAWQQRTTASLRRANVDVMDVPVPSGTNKDRAAQRNAIALPIQRFFRMREAKGAKG